MDPNQFQTHIISLHGYSMSATYLASVTQWYCELYALSIGEPFNHAHNICYAM